VLLDGQILDARNPDEIRRRIGCVALDDDRLADARPPLDHTHSEIATLTAALNTLIADLAVLTAALNALTASVTTLSTVPDLDVLSVHGFNSTAPRSVLPSQYETVLAWCPDDAKYYRILRVGVNGETTFRAVRSDYVEADDGNTYALQVRLVDGLPTLEEPQLVT